MYYLAELGRDGNSWDTFMGADRLHPNDLGHKIMADLVVYLLQQTVSGGGGRPGGGPDLVVYLLQQRVCVCVWGGGG